MGAQVREGKEEKQDTNLDFALFFSFQIVFSFFLRTKKEKTGGKEKKKNNSKYVIPWILRLPFPQDQLSHKNDFFTVMRNVLKEW